MSPQILTVANGVTALRAVLLLFFAWAVYQSRQVTATTLFGITWVLDAVDGLAARQLHQETAVGSLFDKVVDRLLIVGGLVLLLAFDMVPAAAVWLLTKDICLLPALTIHASRREKIAGLGWPGKITTALQGLAIIWLLSGGPAPLLIIAVVASVGGIVAFQHVRLLAYPAAAV